MCSEQKRRESKTTGCSRHWGRFPPTNVEVATLSTTSWLPAKTLSALQSFYNLGSCQLTVVVCTNWWIVLLISLWKSEFASHLSRYCSANLAQVQFAIMSPPSSSRLIPSNRLLNRWHFDCSASPQYFIALSHLSLLLATIVPQSLESAAEFVSHIFCLCPLLLEEGATLWLQPASSQCTVG